MRRAVLYNSKNKSAQSQAKGQSSSRYPAPRRRGSVAEETIASNTKERTSQQSSILSKFRRKSSDLSQSNSASYPFLPVPIIGKEDIGGWKTWLFKGEDRAGRNEGKRDSKYDVPIHPYSRFAQIWESASGLLLLYTAAVTPLLISFYTEQQGYCGRAPTIEVDMAVDLFFLLEIFVHFATGQVVRGTIVLEIRKVARNYFFGDFWRDFLSCSPIAWVEFFLVPVVSCAEMDDQQEQDVQFMRSLRFIRMLKLLRLLKVLKIFNVMRDLLRMRPASVRLIKAGFFVFLIAHIGGCIWWFIKTQTITDGELTAFQEEKGIDQGITSTYLAAVYFVMATLCTVGYGDISAVGDAERFFALFMMLMGASVFAIIVSNMSALAANMQSRENQVLEEMENVVDFMRSNGISVTLEKLVQDFYLFRCRQKTAFTSRLEILEELPDGLHRSIMMELNRNLLSAVWVFDKMDHREIESVVEMFEVQLATPGEVVLDDDATPSCLYIIISGFVNLQVNNTGTYTDVESLTKGEVFGEVGVILSTPCPYRAVACDYVELYKLSREDLDVLNQMSPHMQERLESGAQERMEEFNLLMGGQGGALDRWNRITMLLLRKYAREHLTLVDRAKDRLVKYSVAPGNRRYSTTSTDEFGRRSQSGGAASVNGGSRRGSGNAAGALRGAGGEDSWMRQGSRRRLNGSPLNRQAARTRACTFRQNSPRTLRPMRPCSPEEGVPLDEAIKQVRARLSGLAEMMPVELGGVIVQCACGKEADEGCIESRWQALAEQHGEAGAERSAGASVQDPRRNARVLQAELRGILELLAAAPASDRDSGDGGGGSSVLASAANRHSPSPHAPSPHSTPSELELSPQPPARLHLPASGGGGGEEGGEGGEGEAGDGGVAAEKPRHRANGGAQGTEPPPRSLAAAAAHRALAAAPPRGVAASAVQHAAPSHLEAAVESPAHPPRPELRVPSYLQDQGPRQAPAGVPASPAVVHVDGGVAVGVAEVQGGVRAEGGQGAGLPAAPPSWGSGGAPGVWRSGASSPLEAALRPHSQVLLQGEIGHLASR